MLQSTQCSRLHRLASLQCYWLHFIVTCCDVTIIGLSHRSCSMSSWMRTSCQMPVNTSLITWRPTGEPHTLLKWNLPTPCWRNWQKTHSPPAPPSQKYLTF